MRFVLALGFVASLATSLVLTGCNLGRVAARSSAAVGRNAAPAMEQFFDYEIAGAAMPATIVQLEGMVRSDPTNRFLLLQLTKTYVGYAYGWVEDRVEALELEQQDFRASAYERARAHRLYLRARDLGLYQLGLEDDGAQAAVAAGESAFRRYLERAFDDPEDAPVLFWTGSAWASSIGTSESGLSDSADLPLARALVERSVALDADFAHSAGLGVLGGIEASVLDGDPDQARVFFDRALERTERRSFALLVNMANTVAVQTEDRALFVALLTEVLSAEDRDPTVRLANLVARRRARRLLDHVDNKFP